MGALVDRRRAEAAIAAHQRRHALAQEGLEKGAVVLARNQEIAVAVDVDEAGRDDAVPAVHVASRLQVAEVADVRDAPAGDRDIGAKGLRAAAVDHRAARELEVAAHRGLSWP